MAAVAAARGEVLVCGLLLAVAAGLVWLLFLRCCARCAVYMLLGTNTNANTNTNTSTDTNTYLHAAR